MTRVGPYALLEPLASDDRADVFLGAFDGAPGEVAQHCAVKILKNLGTDLEAARLLVHDLIGLVHPCIPQVFDAGRFVDRLFLAEELVVGLSARELLDAKIELPLQVAAYVASEALRGITAAHTADERPIVHGRLRLASVMVSFEGQVKLVGFGSAPHGATPEADVASLAEVAAALHPRIQPSDRDRRGVATLHAYLSRFIGPHAGPAMLRELLASSASAAREMWDARLRRLERMAAATPAAGPEITAILSDGERELADRAAARALKPERIPEGPIPGTRYAIVRPIGEGGMGVVYAGEHLDLGKQVAIKVLHREHSLSRDGVARFRDEARAASAIQHPNVVAVTDFGEMPDGRLFLVMEYLEGESLASVIEREGALEARRAVEIALEVTAGVSAAHARDVIHRDIKPENIFLTNVPDGSTIAKVLDFGIAKRQGSSLRKTRHGVVCGTPAYMAPEQAAGDPVDVRADVYSLGAVLYEMLTGHAPFQGSSQVEVLRRKMMEMPPPPSRSAPRGAIHPALDAVILHALGTTRAMRHANLAELRADLQFVSRQLEAPRIIDAAAVGFDREVDKEIDRVWAGALRRVQGRSLRQRPAFVAGLSALVVIAVGAGSLLAMRAPARQRTLSAADPAGEDMGESKSVRIALGASLPVAAEGPDPADSAGAGDPSSLEPTSTNARALRTFLAEGDRAIHEGRIGDAIASYRRATFRAPSSGTAWLKLADAHFQLHQYGDAERAARKAVALRSGGVRGRLTLGVILLRQGRAGDARAEWERVLAADPNNRMAKNYLAAAAGSRRGRP
jgi:serine/threonine-protein kinase